VTTAPLLTKPSTPPLSEVARHLVYPTNIVSSGWPRIERRLAEMAIRYDTWQSGAVRLILGRDADDRYASTVGGVTLSIPRQVGKTFTIGSLLIAMCIEYPGLRVVWTSHHLRTTTNTFRAMQGIVRRKKVAPYLAYNGIRTANGEQEIKFTNGSIVMFGARERGFGVGIDAIDILVCDEAQRLSSKSLADMVPTTNQAQHPHGALLFFIGTPPRPTDAGDEFSARRNKALKGLMLNGIYVELSADPEAKLDDVKQWAKANPSYPHRTPHESMLRMRENLTDDDDWRREAMGIWDLVSDFRIMSAWHDRLVNSEPPPPAAIGIAVSIDRAWSSIGVSSAGEIAHLGSHKRERGTDWVVAEAKRIQDQYDIPVVIHGRGPGASLIEPLKEAGVTLIVAGIDDYQDACANMFDRVEIGTVGHRSNTDPLSQAVGVAAWTAGERRTWTRKTGDVSMLEAVTLALWGAEQPIGDLDPVNNVW